jgi:hypothetical protein
MVRQVSPIGVVDNELSQSTLRCLRQSSAYQQACIALFNRDHFTFAMHSRHHIATLKRNQ